MSILFCLFIFFCFFSMILILFFCVFYSDCGAFIVAFAEFLLHDLEIPKEMNIEDMRICYPVSLFSYGKWKQSINIESEFDCQGRLKPKEKGKGKVF